MAANTALALTLHDPDGRMHLQARQALPVLNDAFSAICIRATDSTHPDTLEAFTTAGAHINAGPAQVADGEKVGLSRRQAVDLAQQAAPYALYCDCDRALHWAQFYPQELKETAEAVTRHDFTVLGRTARAFDTHPDVQRDTEQIINRVFHLVSGWDWDVGAGARGLSRAAAQAILTGCPDEELSNDVSWTLYLRSLGCFSLAYLPTEGLEFETPDRFPQEVQAAGGLEGWLRDFDSDPQRWLDRLELAGGHLRAMMPFIRKRG